MKYRFPKYKIRAQPTPDDTLWVCDHCGYCCWGPHTVPSKTLLCCCTGRKGGFRRMRRGSIAEIKAAKAALKEII